MLSIVYDVVARIRIFDHGLMLLPPSGSGLIFLHEPVDVEKITLG